MSYPISGLNTGYHHPGYKVSKPLVPHGVSVILSAPAVFRFTGASNPERHLQAAEILGTSLSYVALPRCVRGYLMTYAYGGLWTRAAHQVPTSRTQSRRPRERCWRSKW